MALDDIIFPDMDQKFDLHDFMALLINANGHDLVIEAGNFPGEAFTHSTLKKYGWNGRYVIVNPAGIDEYSFILGEYPLFVPKGDDVGLQQYLKLRHNTQTIHTQGDGMDTQHLNDILSASNPKNPVYIANAAIFFILSDERERWVPKSEDGQESVRRMAEIWIENLSKTQINRAYLTSFVYQTGKNLEIGFGSIDSSVYELLCGEFYRHGWGVIGRDIKTSPFNANLTFNANLIVAYR